MERLGERLAQARRALATFEELARRVHVYREAMPSDLETRLHLHAMTVAAWLGAMSA